MEYTDRNLKYHSNVAVSLMWTVVSSIHLGGNLSHIILAGAGSCCWCEHGASSARGGLASGLWKWHGGSQCGHGNAFCSGLSLPEASTEGPWWINFLKAIARV